MSVELQTWTNLRLLGFKPQQAAQEHRVAFSPQMWRQGASVKGLQVVLHFLTSKLGVQFASWEWPLLDRRQTRDFQGKVGELLQALEADGSLPRGSWRASLWTTARGDRVLKLLWRLSTLALRRSVDVQAADAMEGKDEAWLKLVIKARKVEVKREMALFERHARRAKKAYARWVECAVRATEESRALDQLDVKSVEDVQGRNVDVEELERAWGMLKELGECDVQQLEGLVETGKVLKVEAEAEEVAKWWGDEVQVMKDVMEEVQCAELVELEGKQMEEDVERHVAQVANVEGVRGSVERLVQELRQAVEEVKRGGVEKQEEVATEGLRLVPPTPARPKKLRGELVAKTPMFRRRPPRRVKAMAARSPWPSQRSS